MGNILKKIHTATGNNFTRRYNYQPGTNQLLNIDNNQPTPTVIASFVYDVKGSQTLCQSEKHYEWDYADCMRSFYNQTGTGVEPTVYAVYLYDGDGNRTKKLVRKQGGTWESVTYVGDSFEYHKKGAEEKNYTQIANVEIRTGSFSGDSSETTFYQLKDHLGSVGLRLNHSGSTIDREEYYPFGDSSLRTFTKKRYRYCGKEKDEESGLYYYGARYYMSWAARFISIDPLAAEALDRTGYHYSSNNPINRNDPDGMKDEGSNETSPKSLDNLSKNEHKEKPKTPKINITKRQRKVENRLIRLVHKLDKKFSVNQGGRASDYYERKNQRMSENYLEALVKATINKRRFKVEYYNKKNEMGRYELVGFQKLNPKSLGFNYTGEIIQKGDIFQSNNKFNIIQNPGISTILIFKVRALPAFNTEFSLNGGKDFNLLQKDQDSVFSLGMFRSMGPKETRQTIEEPGMLTLQTQVIATNRASNKWPLLSYKGYLFKNNFAKVSVYVIRTNIFDVLDKRANDPVCPKNIKTLWNK